MSVKFDNGILTDEMIDVINKRISRKTNGLLYFGEYDGKLFVSSLQRDPKEAVLWFKECEASSGELALYTPNDIGIPINWLIEIMSDMYHLIEDEEERQRNEKKWWWRLLH